jgi:hypothetical protein
MSSFLMNYLPSAVAALVSILTIFQPTIQGLVASHPAIAASLGALYAILTHIIPGSPIPGSDSQK